MLQIINIYCSYSKNYNVNVYLVYKLSRLFLKLCVDCCFKLLHQNICYVYLVEITAYLLSLSESD